MTIDRIDLYFDYLSGYAYFAFMRLRRFCEDRGAALGLHPVLFAGLLNHWGQLGPAEIPPKRAFVYRDGFRIAASLGLPFVCPRFHPFNPLSALRVSLREVSGEAQADVIEAIWLHGWGGGGDTGSIPELAAALDAAGLDGAGLMARVGEPEVKAALEASTEAAIARGVFGVPSMILDGELFWGNDQLPWIEARLDGRDPLTGHEGVIDAILNRPKQADRLVSDQPSFK